jgi:hypothetical protein
MISVPPALTGFGVTLLTTGAGLRTLNPEKEAVLLPDVTVTVAAPAAIPGTIATIEVAEAEAT